MWRVARASAAALLIAACSSVDSDAPPKLPASVVVTFSRSAIAIGETTQATAAIRDENGDPLPNQPMFWQSSDPATATVSQEGVVTAVLSGNVTIIANTGSLRGTAQLSITRPPSVPVATVDVMLSVPTLISTGSARAMAVARAADGTVIAREIRWTSSDPAIASIANDGVVQVHAGGTVTIAAESEGVRAQVIATIPFAQSVTITSVPVPARVGRTYTLEAQARYGDLSPSPRTVHWTLVDPAAGTLVSRVRFGRVVYDFTPRVSGPIDVVATADNASTTVQIEAYGWTTTVTPTGIEAELLSEPWLSAPFEGIYRGKLIVGCGNGAPYVRIATHGPALTGLVQGIDQWDEQGQHAATQWTGSGAVVTQPSLTETEFRALVADMETGATVARVATVGGERMYIFFSEGIRAAMAAQWGLCPEFAP